MLYALFFHPEFETEIAAVILFLVFLYIGNIVRVNRLHRLIGLVAFNWPGWAHLRAGASRDGFVCGVQGWSRVAP